MLAKTKINSIEFLLSKALTNSYISQYEFVLLNNVIKEYDDMREVIEDLKTASVTFKYTYETILFFKI